jgi:FkbH-like protein
MKIRMGRADRFTIPRIAQLTQKTNQFNLTTRRYTEAEIRLAAEDPASAVFWLELQDRFGSSGVVGVLILRCAEPGKWMIDTFLLSCRVMGRTVEDAFLATALRELDAQQVVGEYRPTPKNVPVKGLYARLGFQRVSGDETGEVWSLDGPINALQVPGWFEVSLAEPVDVPATTPPEA